jgi:hypothetical protein
MTIHRVMFTLIILHTPAQHELAGGLLLTRARLVNSGTLILLPGTAGELTDCADRVHRLALARVVLPHCDQAAELGVDDGVGEAVLGVGASQRLRVGPGAIAADRLLVDALVPADPCIDPASGLLGF